jgi:hypothetical protein
VSTSIEPCCHDCFWETKTNLTDYSQGFRGGAKWAEDTVLDMLFALAMWDKDNKAIYDAIASDVRKKLRSEP